MARQVSVTLSDEEYAALEIQAAGRGEAPESLLREAIRQRLRSDRRAPGQYSTREPSKREIEEHLFRMGVIASIPSGDAETPAETAERERLAKLFGQGKPVSELVIEGRGP